jgi:hypothetical protein
MSPIPSPTRPDKTPGAPGIFEGLTVEDLGPDATFFEVDGIPVSRGDGFVIRFDRMPPETFDVGMVFSEGMTIDKDEFLSLVRATKKDQA